MCFLNRASAALSVGLILLLTHSIDAAGQTARDCAPQEAGTTFKFRVARANTTGLPSNQGVVPTGFVNVGSLPVVHGVDVSKYQDGADFRRVRDCGGQFAYVRLSSGSLPDNELEYRVHWANARASGLMAGGYHYLNVPALTLRPEALRKRDLSELSTEATTSARDQAKLFLRRLDEVLSLDPQDSSNPKQLGQPILPIVLSASSSAVAHGALTPTDLKLYAQLYQTEICEWIATVRSSPGYATQPIMLFTYAYIYKDYDFDSAKCNLRQIPMWIAYLGPQGDRYPAANDSQAAVFDDICRQSAGDRCRFQLYTSYGSFLDFAGTPAIDLDRFYGTTSELAALLRAVSKH